MSASGAFTIYLIEKWIFETQQQTNLKQSGIALKILIFEEGNMLFVSIFSCYIDT